MKYNNAPAVAPFLDVINESNGRVCQSNIRNPVSNCPNISSVAFSPDLVGIGKSGDKNLLL